MECGNLIIAMSKTILIIDDDQTLVAPLKEGLEAMGYRVAAAFDASQGVHLAQQAKPDLVILDFYMPGGDGGAVYERLRQGRDTAQTPIVFSTVVSVEEVKGRIRPSAHTYFLRKPVGLGQLAALIRSVLGEPQPAAMGEGLSSLERSHPLLQRGSPPAVSEVPPVPAGRISLRPAPALVFWRRLPWSEARTACALARWQASHEMAGDFFS